MNTIFGGKHSFGFKWCKSAHYKCPVNSFTSIFMICFKGKKNRYDPIFRYISENILSKIVDSTNRRIARCFEYSTIRSYHSDKLKLIDLKCLQRVKTKHSKERNLRYSSIWYCRGPTPDWRSSIKDPLRKDRRRWDFSCSNIPILA